MRAYVLVKAITGWEREALQAFYSVPNLQEVNFTFGKHDFVLTVDTEDTKTLAQFIRDRIRRAPGVAKTATLIEAQL